MEQKEYITRSDIIKDRMWSDKLIRTFLPEPDQIMPNPFYKCVSPMKLYKMERIINISFV